MHQSNKNKSQGVLYVLVFISKGFRCYAYSKLKVLPVGQVKELAVLNVVYTSKPISTAVLPTIIDHEQRDAHHVKSRCYYQSDLGWKVSWLILVSES